MTGAGSTSVIICAYTERRWAQLVAAVDSAARQPDTAEVVVVIDHAPALLDRAVTAWPEHVVIANAETRGLSGARNTGVRAASAPLIGFLDDDAEAEAGWLAALLAPFAAADVVGVGGRAEPVWPGSPPRFLPRELGWIVGCTFTGQPTELGEVRSMLFRRDAVLSVGGFSTDTGRVGRIPLGGEETDLCIRLRAADPRARILFEPRSLVRHHVSDDRATWAYLRRRSFYEGVSKAVLARRLTADEALATERDYVRRVLPRAVVRALLSAQLSEAAGIVLAFAATATGYAWGRVAGPRSVPVHEIGLAA
jgi:GT2 family glycosyltransferase